jgi:hypothetical protein
VVVVSEAFCCSLRVSKAVIYILYLLAFHLTGLFACASNKSHTSHIHT